MECVLPEFSNINMRYRAICMETTNAHVYAYLELLNFETLNTTINTRLNDSKCWIKWMNENRPIPYNQFRVEQAMYYLLTMAGVDAIARVNKNPNLNENEKTKLIPRVIEWQNACMASRNAFMDGLGLPNETKKIDIDKLNKKYNIMSKKTTKDIEMEPCFETRDTPTNPGEITPNEIQQMVDCVNNAANIIRNSTEAVPPSPVAKLRRGRTVNNLQTIEITAEFAASHPNTVNTLINVNEWLQSIGDLRAIESLKIATEKLLISIESYERAESNTIFNDFMRYYRCIQILAAEGEPEALAIWPVMKEVFAHLRGRRGPICPVKEVENAIVNANQVLMNNSDALLKVLNDKRLLAQNLTSEIHKEDHIEDVALHNIHQLSLDK